MKRNHSMDLLRIICAIFIVFIHVTPDYNPSMTGTIPGLFIHPLVRSGLPLFFIISGYFILNSELKSIFSFYKSRLVSVIIPFVIFSFLHYCYFHQWDANAYGIEWSVNYFKSLAFGSPINFGRQYFMTGLYWFIYAIIGLYIISPAIIKSMEFINQSNSAKCLVYLVVFYCVAWFIGGLAGNSGFSVNWLQLPENTKWILYFLIGGIIKRINYKSNLTILIPSIILSYALVVYTYYGSITGAWYSMGWIDSNAAMVLLSTSIFITFHGLNFSFKKNSVTYLSSLTYGVYLIHIVFLSVVSNKTNTLSNNYLTYTLVTGFLVATLAFLMSAIINFAVVNRVIRLLK